MSKCVPKNTRVFNQSFCFGLSNSRVDIFVRFQLPVVGNFFNIEHVKRFRCLLIIRSRYKDRISFQIYFDINIIWQVMIKHWTKYIFLSFCSACFFQRSWFLERGGVMKAECNMNRSGALFDLQNSWVL